MRLPTLEIGGQKYRLRHLDLAATLDDGVAAHAVVWGEVGGVTKGQPAAVAVAGRTFESVVQSFRGSAADGTSFRLVDPVAAARPFRGEAFSDRKKETTPGTAVASRVAAGGPGELRAAKFPA